MNLLGLLFITISIFGGVIKGYCGKGLGIYAHTITDSATLNFIRMIFCAVISLGVTSVQVLSTSGNLAETLAPTPIMLIISGCSALFSCIFLISWLMAVRGSAYMLVSVFTNLGVIVPIVLSAIFFGETITIQKIIGIAILILAIWLMLGYSKGITGALTVKDFLMLLIAGLSNGICDFFNGKVNNLGEILSVNFNLGNPKVNMAAFNFYMYIFSFIILLCYTAFSSVTHHKAQIKISKKIIIYLVVMAVFLFVNTYFKALAGTRLGSAQLFSINTGGSLVLSSIMASIMFREKPTVKSILGIILTFVALLFLQ